VKTVAGIVTYEVRVQCPNPDCKWDLNLTQAPYNADGDYAPSCSIGSPLFGGPSKPAKWSGLKLEYTCCRCKQEFVVDRLEV